ncbi:hypothetical protein EDD90_0958 [Streptomyces sp. Ag109_O5-1]|uniref:hypothetical protein n=1 Tax=Streptomyces sp. Ag109_O5-1 TaxID=1938851 RepID=UPI000F516E55|nr:hypothetical protein [Streptomyces sp. Ag109_O5-1]RPE38090.1 hypothetical protein EDD90_0958 [Streptomyces sp. Ag109_O5-1]
MLPGLVPAAGERGEFPEGLCHGPQGDAEARGPGHLVPEGQQRRMEPGGFGPVVEGDDKGGPQRRPYGEGEVAAQGDALGVHLPGAFRVAGGEQGEGGERFAHGPDQLVRGQYRDLQGA